jgi:hypothetical protein
MSFSLLSFWLANLVSIKLGLSRGQHNILGDQAECPSSQRIVEGNIPRLNA